MSTLVIQILNIWEHSGLKLMVDLKDSLPHMEFHIFFRSDFILPQPSVERKIHSGLNVLSFSKTALLKYSVNTKAVIFVLTLKYNQNIGAVIDFTQHFSSKEGKMSEI